MMVRRRNFLGFLSFGTAAAAFGGSAFLRFHESEINPITEDIPTTASEMKAAVQRMSGPAPDRAAYLKTFTAPLPDEDALAASTHRNDTEQIDTTGNDETQLARYLQKMDNFERSHVEDVFLPDSKRHLLTESFKRIDRVQSLVGHGNFNVLGFDDMLRYAAQYERVGSFTAAELEFLEGLFFEDAEQYGFYGEKVIDSLTAVVSTRDRVKVSHTGHYLFRGRPEEIYNKIKQDVGGSIVLTSGIRGIVKQTHLFLAKAIQSEGNLSLASRSLAPPGHSFHGIGDFDVGKVGFGARNFTADFSSTDEFRRLVDLGYLDIRYPLQNLLGVRYEPWHIKVV